MRTFVVGDIHGYRETLVALCEKLALTKDDKLICVGDYIDRGPNSFGVIEYLLGLQKSGISFEGLLGNHETSLFDAIGYGPLLPDGVARNGENLRLASNGFPETAKSYGWNYVHSLHNLNVVKLPDTHMEFFLGLKQYILLPGFLIVHAHLGRGALRKPTAEEAVQHQLADIPSVLQFERETLDCPKLFPELLIHGHYPTHKLYVPGTQVLRNRGDVRIIDGKLNLDSSVIRGGPLTAVELPSLEIIQQQNIG